MKLFAGGVGTFHPGRGEVVVVGTTIRTGSNCYCSSPGSSRNAINQRHVISWKRKSIMSWNLIKFKWFYFLRKTSELVRLEAIRCGTPDMMESSSSGSERPSTGCELACGFRTCWSSSIASRRLRCGPCRKACCNSLTAGGLFLGFFVRETLTNAWKSVDHLFFSLRIGGLNPLFDIRKRARIGCKSNMGGCNSASSIAVIPTAQMSHCWS